MRRVVVLRPEPGASETVARAREQGLDAVGLPLFEIEPFDWDVPDPSQFDGLLLTSANAVRHGGAGLERLRGLPVHAVGQATAEAARNAGFAVETIGSGDVDDLLATLPSSLKLLHLCGEDRRAPSDGRHRVRPVALYRSAPRPRPGDLSVLEGSLALIHSPRAGERLQHLIDPASRVAIAVAAISEAAAQAAGEGWARVEAADQPTDEALLALAARLCNKP